MIDELYSKILSWHGDPSGENWRQVLSLIESGRLTPADCLKLEDPVRRALALSLITIPGQC